MDQPSVALAPPSDAQLDATPRSRRRTQWAVKLLVVATLSFGIVAASVPQYLTLDPSVSRVGIRPDVPFHFPVLVLHATTAGLALLLGPLQFSARLRRRVPTVHRVVGRVYLFAGVLPGAVSGLVVALLTTAGPAAAVGFGLLDAFWITSAVLAYRAVRQHRYRDHGRWMMRNFAAVTLRAWLGILIVVQLPLLDSVYHGDFGRLFDTAYSVVPWLAWIPNLLFIEWYVRRRADTRG